MELMDYRQLYTPSDCTSMQGKIKEECDKMSIVYDHKDNHKVGGQNSLAVTKGQFCAMFYHVTKRKRDKISFKCLEKSKCKIGNLKTKKRQHPNPRASARTVVVYVRLTAKSANPKYRLKFQARYGNCFQGKRRNTIHAEHFMLEDEEFKQAVKRLGDQKEVKIEMYMNKQPCFRSTRVKTEECAQELVNFYKLFCLLHGIKLTVNLCQLSRVDVEMQLPSPSLNNDIQNARRGMQMMMSAGIELKAMNEESWRTLADDANIKLPEYIDGDRQKLDQHIEEFLQGIKPTYFFRQFTSRNPSKGIV